MTTYDYPRVSVAQKNQGPSSITGVSTSVAFFMGRAVRGRTDKPLPFSSFDEFQRLFGSSWDDNSYVPEAISAFFAKAGKGSRAFFARCLGGSGGSNVKALVILPGGGNGTRGGLTGTNFPVKFVNGDTFTASVNAGGGLLATINAFAAAKTGASATYAAVPNGNHLDLTINGVTLAPIVFDGSESTQALFLGKINASLPGAAALNASGQVQIKTDRQGTSAAGTVAVATSAAVLTSLGLTTGAFAALGVSNVPDVDSVTSTDLDALFEAAFTGASSDPSGASLYVYSDTVGVSSSFQFTSGTGVAKVTGFDNALHSGAGAGAQPSLKVEATGPGDDYHSIYARPTKRDVIVGGITAPIAPATVPFVLLNSLAQSKLVVGDQIKISDGATTIRGVISVLVGNKATFEATAPAASGTLATNNSVVTLETFDLLFLENGTIAQGPYKDLRMSPLSLKNFVETKVNTGNDSALLVVDSQNPVTGSASYDVRPTSVLAIGDYLSGGSVANTFSDADFIGQDATHTGIYATDLCTEAVGAAAPGLSMAAQKALADYGKSKEAYQFFTAIDTDAETDDAAQAVAKRNGLGSNDLAAMYFPWTKIVSPQTGQAMNIPTSGYALGVFAAVDRNRGVQKAPAGTSDAQLPLAIGLARDLSDGDRKTLFASGVNYVQSDKRGIRLYGSRTLDPSSDLAQISHSRTFLYLRRSLYEGLEFLVYEPNDEPTRAKAVRVVRGFLRNEWKKGTLEGRTPQDAYVIVCDETNNPPEVRAAGRFVVDIGARVPDVSEFVDVGVTRIQANFEE